MKFNHLGIVVPDLLSGRCHFSTTYDIREWSDEFTDKINGVYVQFCRDSNGFCFELVAPINNNSPVFSALEKKDNILNHIAYLVDDIDKKSQFFQSDFISLGKAQEALAYEMKRIQFFYSKDFNYCLELIEAPNHSHTYYPINTENY